MSVKGGLRAAFYLLQKVDRIVAELSHDCHIVPVECASGGDDPIRAPNSLNERSAL